MHFLGGGLVRSGRTEEGLERLRQACRSAEMTARADPDSAFAHSQVAAVRAELGLALATLHIRPSEMCASLRQSVTIWSRLDREGRLQGEDRPSLERMRTLLGACPREQAVASSQPGS